MAVEEISLTEDDDPDCAHVTLIRIRDKWACSFDFRYNKALSREHIRAAAEFYEAAEFSVGQENWSAFIDNLFSAVELSAKALLLSFPDPKFRKKAEHHDIKKKFYWFADLGNVQPMYRETFTTLMKLRYPARYLEGNLSVTPEEAHMLLRNAKSMMKDVSSQIRIALSEESQ